MTRHLERERMRAAEHLSTDLAKFTGYAATATVDGRVVVYAPKAAGAVVLAKVKDRIRPHFRTARIVDVSDARLAIVEVSGVGRV